MPRFSLFIVLIGFLVFVPSDHLTAQVLLDPSAGSGLGRSFKLSGTGGGSALPNRFNNSGEIYPPNSSLLDSAPGSSGINIDVNSDFSMDTPANKVPSYNIITGFDDTYDPNRYEGLTREEIVRRKAREARAKAVADERREIQMRIQIEAKRELKRGIDALFFDAGSLPNVLAPNPKVPVTNPDNPLQSMDVASPRVPSPSSQTSALKTDTSASSAFISRASAAQETALQDERKEQELKDRIARLEDPEKRQRELKIISDREEVRKRWLAQQAEAERGADLFEPPLTLKQQKLNEGWNFLFDYQTFFGWRIQNKGPYAGGQFKIVNGEIRSDPQHPGLLYTTNQFGDMTLEFDFQAEESAEAFLLLRTPANPQDLHSSCYTVVLNSANPERPRGMVLGRHPSDSNSFREIKKTDQPAKSKESSKTWHKVKIQFESGRLEIRIDQNDQMTLLDPKPLRYGYLGFLVAKGNVRFCNIIWAPGSSLSLSDPISPEKNWRYHDDVNVTAKGNGVMQIDGTGMVESITSYHNFVLQLEYYMDFPSTPAALSFRSIPREEQTGYKISLQNFPKRQDRDSTVGVDAGSFYGKKNARYIRAKDQQWNYLTLSVIDRQFQTWINGVPVCETTEKRLSEKENLKDGPFLLPGTLQLFVPQEHTNVKFRNIQVMPIEPRFETQKTFDDMSKTTWEELSKARKAKEAEEELDKKKMSEKKK